MTDQAIRVAAFDFDYTLINANSLNYLNKLVMKHEALSTGKEFRTPSIAQLNKYKFDFEDDLAFAIDRIKLLNARFDAMHSKYGIGRDQMVECLCELKLSESMKRLLESLSQRYKLMIISDSNTFVIESILRANDVLGLFDSRIYANPASFDHDGRLVARPLSSEHFGFDQSFTCSLASCRPNICKGQVLAKAVQAITSTPPESLIYVGDGSIDLCPGLSLSPNDAFFVKTGSSLARLLDANEAELKARLKCKLRYWKNADEIARQLEQTLI